MRIAAALLATGIGIGACSEDDGAGDDDGAEVSDDREGPSHDVPGVGLIRYGAGVRSIATVNLPAGGAVHFVESEESAAEEGHGCAGYFPADAPGDPAMAYDGGNDGCLGTFLKLTSPDTPVPAALLVDNDRLVDMDRRIVEKIDEPIMAMDLPLAAKPHPVAGGDFYAFDHSCTGDLASSTHWTSVHCDEGGADHCDPDWQTYIDIVSGVTYKGSYQTALFCGGDAAGAEHSYYDGVSWGATLEWSNAAHYPSNAYVQWSTWVGAAPWRRQVIVQRTPIPSSDYFHSYTKMCAGSGDCPHNG